MLQRRLKALKLFERKPMPTWGADLSEINFDTIKYYVRSTERQANSWEELPADIKNTYDRLGIPEAEKARMVPVWRPSTSPKSSIPQDQRGAGAPGRHLPGHRYRPEGIPGDLRGVLRLGYPAGDKQIRRAEHGGLVGRLVHLRAEGRARPDSVAGLLPDQHREHGPVRAHADHRRRGLLRPLCRGLHGADLQDRLAARRSRRDHREEARPGAVHDHPELVDNVYNLSPSVRRSTRAAPWSGSTATSGPRSP